MYYKINNDEYTGCVEHIDQLQQRTLNYDEECQALLDEDCTPIDYDSVLAERFLDTVWPVLLGYVRIESISACRCCGAGVRSQTAVRMRRRGQQTACHGSFIPLMSDRASMTTGTQTMVAMTESAVQTSPHGQSGHVAAASTQTARTGTCCTTTQTPVCTSSEAFVQTQNKMTSSSAQTETKTTTSSTQVDDESASQVFVTASTQTNNVLPTPKACSVLVQTDEFPDKNTGAGDSFDAESSSYPFLLLNLPAEDDMSLINIKPADAVESAQMQETARVHVTVPFVCDEQANTIALAGKSAISRPFFEDYAAAVPGAEDDTHSLSEDDTFFIIDRDDFSSLFAKSDLSK